MAINYNSTRNIMVALGDAFNDVHANMDNGKGTMVDIRVPLKVSSTSKMLKNLRNKQERFTLPVMSLALSSIDFDEERAMPIHNKVLSTSQFQNLIMPPAPYTYEFELSVWTKKESELFDIIEQFMPLYRQMRTYPLIEFKFSDGSFIQRDLPIIIDSTALDIQADELSEEEDDTYRVAFPVMVKGWVYSPNCISSNVKLIEHIDIKFMTMLDEKFENMTILSQTGGTSSVQITTGETLQ